MKSLMNTPLNSIKKRLREIEISKAPVLPPPKIGLSLISEDGAIKVLVKADGGEFAGRFAGLPQLIHFKIVKP